MSRKRVTGAIVGVTTGLGLGLVSIISATPAAAAGPVEKTVGYSCVYPLIGARPLTVKVKAYVPTTFERETASPDIVITTANTVGPDTTEGLAAIGVKSLEGFATAKVTVNGPGGVAPVNMDVRQILGVTPVPPTGSFEIGSYGKAPGIGFDFTGAGNLVLGDLNLKVTGRTAAGQPAGTGTFDVPCKQTSPTGTTVLADINVVDTPVTYEPAPTPYPPAGTWTRDSTVHPPTTLTYDLNLKGSSFIKSANGTLPLDGKIKVTVDGKTGDITGPLTLNKTKGQFSILGFFPLTADISFQQVGDTVGKYANGEIDTVSTMYVKYSSFNAFGFIPVGGGDKCQTPTPSKIAMHTKRGVFFNPYKGGDYVADDYPLSGTENCGFLNPILGVFATGPGNTITAKLIPPA
ncbi:hypothetical protein GCM10027589_07450 [Actinocorallia lasiicapitis]